MSKDEDFQDMLDNLDIVVESIEDIALSEKSLPSTTTSAGEPGPGSGCSFLTTKA